MGHSENARTGLTGGSQRLSRRQVMGRAGAVATAGVAAWVVPEILVAQPGSAAGLSGNPGGTGTGVGTSTSVSTPAGGASVGAGVSTSASTTGSEPAAAAGGAVTTGDSLDPTGGAGTPTMLAATGLDIEREVELGAALIAGGWALHHWSSRAQAGAGGPSERD